MNNFKVFKGKNKVSEPMRREPEYYKDAYDCPICQLSGNKTRMHYIENCGSFDNDDQTTTKIEAHSCPSCDAWFYVDINTGESIQYHFYGRSKKKYEKMCKSEEHETIILKESGARENQIKKYRKEQEEKY